MLQPPNQLTYPLHIRTILQKNKEKKWNVIGQFYTKKLHFRINFLLSATDDSRCMHFQKLNTYYLVPGVQLFTRRFYKTL